MTTTTPHFKQLGIIDELQRTSDVTVIEEPAIFGRSEHEVLRMVSGPFKKVFFSNSLPYLCKPYANMIRVRSPELNFDIQNFESPN